MMYLTQKDLSKFALSNSFVLNFTTLLSFWNK